MSFLEGEETEVFDDERVSLLASGSLMRNRIEGSLDAVDGEPGIVSVVDTDPPEANCLQPSLQLHIH